MMVNRRHLENTLFGLFIVGYLNDNRQYLNKINNATIGINSGIFNIYAVDTTNPPSAREPVSPINTLAGCVLKHKNPSKAPITAQITGWIPAFVPTAITVKNTAIKVVTLAARPSSPSVKFAPFTVPSTTTNNTGIYKITEMPFFPPETKNYVCS